MKTNDLSKEGIRIPTIPSVMYGDSGTITEVNIPILSFKEIKDDTRYKTWLYWMIKNKLKPKI